MKLPFLDLFFNRLLKVLSVLFILYPVFVYFGLKYLSPHILLYSVCGLLGVRALLSDISLQKRFLLLIGTGFIGLLGIGVQPELGVKSYPVMMNIGLFFLFVSSLFSPQNIIEKLARKMESDFPDSAIPYTRKVCIAWCVFFIFNGSVATLTLFLSAEIWALYNGIIAYILIGCMFAVEFCIRLQVKKKNKKTEEIQRGIICK